MLSLSNTSTITVYGYSDRVEAEQSVEVQYSGQYSSRRLVIDSVQVVTPLEIEPGDLYTDLCDQINEIEQMESTRIECEIELTELVHA
jgi:hypothetical protein